jgi:hypothetical protein
MGYEIRRPLNNEILAARSGDVIARNRNGTEGFEEASLAGNQIRGHVR